AGFAGLAFQGGQEKEAQRPCVHSTIHLESGDLAMRIPCVRGGWLAALLCVSSLGAAGTEAPLADAVEHRDQQAVLALLNQHVDVNARQSDGATALHWAAYLDDADTTAL